MTIIYYLLKMVMFILYYLYSNINEHKLCSRGRINISIFNRENITGFLDWLESSRNVSVSTRNQRLAALKSFCRYASSNTVEHLEIFQQVLGIKPKKGMSKTVDYLSVDAITLLLNSPIPIRLTASGIWLYYHFYMNPDAGYRNSLT